MDFHTFNVAFAEKYGLEHSVIMYNLVYWCEHNEDNDRNFHDGLYWTFNSVKAFREEFPYIKPYTINKVLKELEEYGLIKTGNYNETTYDRTTWYAVTEKGFIEFGESISRKRKIHLLNSQNGFVENEEPIPNKEPNIKPSINSIHSKERKKDVPSDVEEAREYARHMGYTDFDVDSWYDFNVSRGWKMKSGAIKDWKACLRTAYRSGYNRVANARNGNEAHPINPRVNRLDTEIPF